MEIKRAFRAFRYTPKYLAKEGKHRRIGGFPQAVAVCLVVMVFGGLWLTKVVEKNISEAVGQQVKLLATRPKPAPPADSIVRPKEDELQISFRPDYLVRPVESNEVIRALGWLKHPRFGYWLYHNGIDLALPPGSVVRAVGPGQVSEIIRNYDEDGLGVAGQRVRLSHGQEGTSEYIFPGVVLVGLGNSVSAGTALGTVRGGQDGRLPVHISVSMDGKDLDWLAILENRG